MDLIKLIIIIIIELVNELLFKKKMADHRLHFIQRSIDSLIYTDQFIGTNLGEGLTPTNPHRTLYWIPDLERL
jgi:hypothetical protein